ncbi:hypothetical protein ACH470_39430 [Streptomyces bottropensis]|uniref:hypothetical protein n=1 Tax=Streptomyces bottropensis TaxID=42235 RepID=UPI0037A6EE36
MRRHAGARARIWRDGGATRAGTVSSASTFAGSTGATATCRRLRISGTIEEQLGRNVTVASPAPLSATASKALIRRSWQTPGHRPTDQVLVRFLVPDGALSPRRPTIDA